MKKIFKSFLCIFCALVTLLTISCSKEVDYETFKEEAYELKEDADDKERGSFTVTGKYNYENVEFYDMSGGGEWEFKAKIDPDLASLLSGILSKYVWAINVDAWWGLQIDSPEDWKYKVGDIFELTDGEVTYKFASEHGRLIEYSDSEKTIIISWR